MRIVDIKSFIIFINSNVLIKCLKACPRLRLTTPSEPNQSSVGPLARHHLQGRCDTRQLGTVIGVQSTNTATS